MSKKKSIILTQRDQLILISLFKNKVLSLDQVSKTFFTSSSRVAAAARMRALNATGYISKRRFEIESKFQNIYEINEKGVQTIQGELEGEVTSKNFKSDSVAHDLELFNICERIKAVPAIRRIITESELQSCGDCLENSDLRSFVQLRTDRFAELMDANKNTTLLSIEYERSTKRRSQILRKLKDYYTHKKVKTVIYVCRTEPIKKVLMDADLELRGNELSKMNFITLERFMTSSEKIIFEKINGSPLVLHN